MTNMSFVASRRSLLAAGLSGSAAALSKNRAVAAVSGSGRARDFPSGRSDENSLSASDKTLSPRVRSLIKISTNGIARENRAAMRAFFHPQYRFHGPGEAELDREKLWGYFAACRFAFDDFTVTRQTVVSDGDAYLATRTRFAGRFLRQFSGIPGKLIEPNGKRVEYRLINIFRYAPDGRLAEEWAQYDLAAFVSQLRKQR